MSKEGVRKVQAKSEGAREEQGRNEGRSKGGARQKQA